VESTSSPRFFTAVEDYSSTEKIIIALARPQSFSTGENVYTEGIDIAVLFPW